MSRKAKIISGCALALALVGVIIAASINSPRGLTLTLISRSNDFRFGSCEIGMTNLGGTVTYRGFGKESPLYSVVRETPSGATTNSTFECGLGLRDVTLNHGDGLQFSVVFLTND